MKFSPFIESTPTDRHQWTVEYREKNSFRERLQFVTL